jgi:hypothetical protein
MAELRIWSFVHTSFSNGYFPVTADILEGTQMGDAQ